MTMRWWFGAVAAVTLMLAASARPYFMVYQPHSWTREHQLQMPGPSRFDLPIEEVDNYANLPRVGVIELGGLERVEDDNNFGVYVPAEFDGWILLTHWNAPPDSLLAGCQVWFTGSDGRKYELPEQILLDTPGATAGVLPDEARQTPTCTPQWQSGPRYSWPDGELENLYPRPEKWENLIAISMPDGVRPTEFHFGWSTPHYVTVRLPESKPFLDDLVGSSEK